METKQNDGVLRKTAAEQNISRWASWVIVHVYRCIVPLFLKLFVSVLNTLKWLNLLLNLTTEPVPQHHHSLSAHLLLKCWNVSGTSSWWAALSGHSSAGGLNTPHPNPNFSGQKHRLRPTLKKTACIYLLYIISTYRLWRRQRRNFTSWMLNMKMKRWHKEQSSYWRAGLSI